MAEQRMDVERDEGDPVGVSVDEGLAVVKVVPGSLADGNLLVGDVILSVNGERVRERDTYYQKLRFAFPRLTLTYRRGGAGSAPEEKVPAEFEKFLRRRSGFDYLTAVFDWPAHQDRQLGIVLANRLHRVIVGSLKSGSLGEEKLKVLDRIVAIDFTPVSDKDIAKHLIVGSGGKFTALVERPVSDEARKEFALKSQVAPEVKAAGPQVNFSDVGGDPRILPSDCLLITKTIRDAGLAPPPSKGILRPPQLTRTSSKIDIKSQSSEHVIASDVDPAKRLRHVPKG